jgi:hypothetical protein
MTVSLTSDIFWSSFSFHFYHHHTAFPYYLFPFLAIYILFCAVSINCHIPATYFLVYAVATISVTSASSISITAVSASIDEHF